MGRQTYVSTYMFRDHTPLRRVFLSRRFQRLSESLTVRMCRRPDFCCVTHTRELWKVYYENRVRESSPTSFSNFNFFLEQTSRLKTSRLKYSILHLWIPPAESLNLYHETNMLYVMGVSNLLWRPGHII